MARAARSSAWAAWTNFRPAAATLAVCIVLLAVCSNCVYVILSGSLRAKLLRQSYRVESSQQMTVLDQPNISELSSLGPVPVTPLTASGPRHLSSGNVFVILHYKDSIPLGAPVLLPVDDVLGVDCRCNPRGHGFTGLMVPSRPPMSAFGGANREDVLSHILSYLILVVLGVYFCSSWCTIYRGFRAVVLRTTSCSCVAALKNAVRNCGLGTSADLDSQHVRIIANSLRLAHARTWLRKFTIYMLVIQWIDSTSLLQKELTAHDFFYETLAVPLFVFIVFIFPSWLDTFRSLTPAHLDRMNVMMSFCYSWCYVVMGYLRGAANAEVTTESGTFFPYEYKGAQIYGARLFMMLIFGNAKLTALLQVYISVVDVYTFSVASDWLDKGNPAYIVHQMLLCTALCLVAFGYEQRVFAEARALHQADASDKTYRLARRVLDGTCDTVVRLDANLALAEHCPRLAHVLMRQPKSVTVGCRFLDFVLPSDQEALLAHARAEEDATHANETREDPASAVHVHMLDSMGNKVAVRLFWCCSMDAEERLYHMVGITEEGEAPKGSMQSSSTGVRSVPEATSLAFAEEADDVFSHSLALSSAAASVSAGGSEDDEGPEQVSACVDAADDSLAFLRYSSSFGLLCRPRAVGSGLCDWMGHSDFQNFKQQLTSSTTSGSFPVVLRPPGLKGWKYKADCSISTDNGLTATPLGCDAAGCQPRDLVFRNVHLASSEQGVRNLRGRRSSHATSMTRLRVRATQFDIVIERASLRSPLRERLSSLKVGESMRACLQLHETFTRLLMGLAHEVFRGERTAGVDLDLGCWQLRATNASSQTVVQNVQIIATGFEPSEGSTTGPEIEAAAVCHLILQVPKTEKRPSGAAGQQSSCRNQDTGIWIVLGMNRDSLTITEWDAALERLLEASPGDQDFLEWPSTSDQKQAFADWMMSLWDTAPNTDFGQIALQPSSMKTQGWQLVARSCICERLPRDFESTPAAQGILGLRLFGVRRMRQPVRNAALASPSALAPHALASSEHSSDRICSL